jgi:hypothetical protein
LTDDADAEITITSPVKLVSPNGGETWTAGSTQTIRWTYATGLPEVGCTEMIIETPGSQPFSVPLGENGVGSFNWALPASLPGGSYTLRIFAGYDAFGSDCPGDTNDAPFTVVGGPPPTPPRITLTSPNGGETWRSGIPQTISWTYAGIEGNSVAICLRKRNPAVGLACADNVPIGTNGSGSFQWTQWQFDWWPLPTLAGDDYFVEIQSLGTFAMDASDADFSIDGTPPFGWMDEAKDAADGDATIPRNGVLFARGWAVDNESGAPVARLEVRIDGVAVGNATLGSPRLDVAAGLDRQDFVFSGWSFNFNIGNLSPGTHSVTAVAFDTVGRSAELGGAKTITVASNLPPFGWMDEAKDAADGDAAIPQNGNLFVRGWAVDNEDAAPVTRVEIRIDGVAVGNATLGSARQDIANAYGRQDFLASGWSLNVNIGNLSLGQHTVTAVAFDSANVSTALGPGITIAVVSANQAPQGWMDEAVDAADGDAAIPQNGNLFVRGWAVDNEDGAPVTRVEVRINGVAVGDAVLGGARQDIVNAYGRGDFLNSGWSLTVNIGALAAGTHAVTVVAFDSAGASTQLGPARNFTVP